MAIRSLVASYVFVLCMQVLSCAPPFSMATTDDFAQADGPGGQDRASTSDSGGKDRISMVKDITPDSPTTLDGIAGNAAEADSTGDEVAHGDAPQAPDVKTGPVCEPHDNGTCMEVLYCMLECSGEDVLQLGECHSCCREGLDFHHYPALAQLEQCMEAKGWYSCVSLPLDAQANCQKIVVSECPAQQSTCNKAPVACDDFWTCAQECPTEIDGGLPCIKSCVIVSQDLWPQFAQCLDDYGYWQCGWKNTPELCRRKKIASCLSVIESCHWGEDELCPIWNCAQQCANDDTHCLATCKWSGKPVSQALFGELYNCVQDHCRGEPTQQCLAEALDGDCFSLYKPCCLPDCEDNECGDNGCHGTCGYCSDGLPCTEGFCVDGQCSFNVIDEPGCCVTAANCDDGIKCTLDICDGDSHQCVYQAQPDGSPPCCMTVDDCNDSDPGTIDECTDDHTCKWTQIPPWAECHLPALPCDDCNPCTEDLCINYQCKQMAIPDCCAHDIECDDGNECTIGACNTNYLQCQISVDMSLPMCCETPADCHDGYFGTWDLCVDNMCKWYGAQPKRCLDTWPHPSSACSDGDPCTCDFCLLNLCHHLTIDVAPDWCNIPDSCCYEHEHCDDGNACTLDTCEFETACHHEDIPACCLTDEECDDGLPETLDECYLNSCYHGIPGCWNDWNCVPDNDPCTDTICLAGKCLIVPTTNPNCCVNSWECTDGDPCTADICNQTTHTCQHEFALNPPGCCTEDSQCDDGVLCTLDLCKDQHCQHFEMLP